MEEQEDFTSEGAVTKESAAGTVLPAASDPGFTSLRPMLFAKAYLETGGDKVEAARRAGYTGSTASLRVRAERLLDRQEVEHYITTHLRAIITPEEVAAIISNQVRSTIGNFIDVDENGEPKLNLNKPEAQDNLRQIKKLKPGRYGWSIEMHDPTPILLQLARGMFQDDPEKLHRRAGEKIFEALPEDLRERVISELRRSQEIEAEPAPTEEVTYTSEGPDFSWLQNPPPEASHLIDEEEEEPSSDEASPLE